MRHFLSLPLLLLSVRYASGQVPFDPETREPDITTVITAPPCDDDGTCRYPIFDTDVATSVSYINSSGLAIIFGDIIIDTVENFLQYETDLPSGTILKRKRGVSVDRPNRWPSATVTYKYDSEATKTQRSEVFESSIANWKAILPFLNFVELPPGAAENGVTRIIIADKCASSVGYRTDDTMNIILAAGCGVPEVVHEIGHALGLYHEQSRSDRAANGVGFVCRNLLDYDQYTTMDKTCCPTNADDCCDSASTCCAGKACNFRFAASRGPSLEGGAYDLDSLMHYFDTAFGLIEDGFPRVTLPGAPTEPQVRARIYPSTGDAAKICELYDAYCGGYCGDSIRQAEEECDFNSGVPNCSRLCKLERCGDGIVQEALGEECDPGTGNDERQCTRYCKYPACGDGIVQPLIGETCDDGNLVDGDGCSSTCKIETCGDGIVQTGLGEECDDGNTIDGDGCSSKCKKEDGGIIDPNPGTGWETYPDPSKPPTDYPTPDPTTAWQNYPDPSKPPTNNPTPIPNPEWETYPDPSNPVPNPHPEDPTTQPEWEPYSDQPDSGSDWETYSNPSNPPKSMSPSPSPNPSDAEPNSNWEPYQGPNVSSGDLPTSPAPNKSGSPSAWTNYPLSNATVTTSGLPRYTGAADVQAKVNTNWLLGGLALIQAGLLI